MKVGDLVKYRSYHTGLQDRLGCVVEFMEFPAGDRVRVLWNRPPRWPEARLCWRDELEVISESRSCKPV